MRHKTLTGEDRRRARPTAERQEVLRAAQKYTTQPTCTERGDRKVRCVLQDGESTGQKTF